MAVVGASLARDRSREQGSLLQITVDVLDKTAPVDFSGFEAAYKVLSEKRQLQVFELGFLR